MARSHKKEPRSSFVVIPLGLDDTSGAGDSKPSTQVDAGTKVVALEIVLRLRFTLDVEVETAEERDAL